MYQSVNWYQFKDAMQKHDTHFSIDGLDILFDYLEALEQDIGEEMELDPIALRCDYAEALPMELAEDYDIDISEATNDEEVLELVKAHLEDEGALIGVTDKNTIVYRQF
jgi:hypothetical protein